MRYALLPRTTASRWTGSEPGSPRAKQALDRLYLTLRDLPGPAEATPDALPEGVLAALEDDLNTPKAFAELRALARAANASADPQARRALKASASGRGPVARPAARRTRRVAEDTGESTLDGAEIERLVELRGHGAPGQGLRRGGSDPRPAGAPRA